MPLADAAIYAVVTPILWWVFINGWDELLVDACFLWFKLRGHRNNPVAPEQLNAVPQRRTAVFVPLWREYAVIEEMIQHNIAAVEYSNYDIFLGVYPNDPRTLEKVMVLEERYPQVHRAMCPGDGPTNKADCLNWIYQRMLLEEEARGIRYEVVVQHDAEDIMHPRSLRLVNALAGDYDMVQIPVFPLATPFRSFTHGTYCDEFAEWQVKDMYTRQLLGGFVPSAGVGTGYRREALEEIARQTRNQIFQVATLTEDYEIGLRFKLLGKRQLLVAHQAPRARNGNGNGHANGNGNGNGNGHKNGNGTFWTFKRWRQRIPTNGRARNAVEIVATREYFPNTFRMAVRQKSRWVMGVALQSWRQHGWPGSAGQKYWLWRDRKGLAGNLVTVVCNLIFAYCLSMWMAAHLFDTEWTLERVFPPGYASSLLLLNTAFLAERLAFRWYSVKQIYGARQASYALLRTPWGNLINFCSTVTALATFAQSAVRRREVAWAKTAHAFPDRGQLMEFKRRLGDMLLEMHAVSAEQLEQSLALQAANGGRLGEILVRSGALAEWELIRSLGRQQSMEPVLVDPDTVAPAVVEPLPRELAERRRIVPFAFRNSHSLRVAGPDVLTAEAQVELARAAGLRIEQALTTEANWSAAFAQLYARPASNVGRALVSLGLLTETQLAQAEAIRRQTRRQLAQVLYDFGWVTDETLRRGFQEIGEEFRRVAPADILQETAALIPPALQRELTVVPVRRADDAVVMAIAEALSEADCRRLADAARSPIRTFYCLLNDVLAILDGRAAAV